MQRLDASQRNRVDPRGRCALRPHRWGNHGLGALVFLTLLPEIAHALIPEPPHLIRGVVTVNGVPRTWGTVSLRVGGSPDPIAAVALGSLPGPANGYVLEVPLDALEPQAPGTARPGDAAQLYLDEVAAAAVTIGGRGSAQTMDLALAAAHAIVLIRGPTGTPSPTPAGGAVYLDLEAADTQAHPLSYSWSANCPGPYDGSFDDAHVRAPIWTAPPSGSEPLGCTLTVAVDDGHGLAIAPSLALNVRATVAPEPVPQILVHPDPSLCGAPMSFDGGESFHANPERSLVAYEWDFDYDGASFDVDATGTTAVHAFVARAAPVTVALRVTDDGVPPRSAIATRVVHPGGVNRPPVANAGGPYTLGVGGSLALDGSGSGDPDGACGDGIASWEWDLDGNGIYDDASGPMPVLAWAEAEALLCGGVCEQGRAYFVGLRVTDERGARAEGWGQVSVALLIFADDFADGGAAGDPEWQVLSGSWSVPGRTPGTRFYASSPKQGGLALVQDPGLAALAAGGLDTRIALTRSFVSYANGAVVFGCTDSAHYRWVRVQYQRSAWKLVIGQTGTIGTERAGAKASRTLRGLRLGRWYRLWVDVYEDGLVNVHFNARRETPALSYRFPAAAPGRPGYQACKARALFDDFAAWDRGVLP